MALSDFQSLLERMLRDPSEEISAADREGALALALERYSQDRPLRLTLELDFVRGRAQMPARMLSVLELRHPDRNETRAFSVLETPQGRVIDLDHCAESLTLWIRGTGAHRLDEAEDTVPKGDRQALCHFAAFKLYEDLAGAFAGDRDGMIAADSVDHGSKSADFARRAARHYNLYHALLGLKAGRRKGGSAVVNLNARPASGAYLLDRRSEQ